ncbi:MAG: tagaturonate reductase [Eubacterium sp.]|nr:tagaturonate reductase [Eubacterium sp.]
MKKILQIGEGNFLRAFAEDYIQKANEKGLTQMEVIICQPRNNTKVINSLKAQKCLYDITLSGRFNGKVVDERKTINCVSECFDSHGEYDKLENLFCSDELEIVISNTTEAGICFDENERYDDIPNMNIPSRLTNLLYKRYSSGKKGIIFLPVELIENNADTLKKYILDYAKLWHLESRFINYISSECSFCNTLVDRIVSGHKSEDKDPCSVAAEPYASWVIQADERLKKVLPLNGFEGIQFTDNLSPYRTRKVRILNGTHTMSVLAAYMSGIDIVRDMMNNEIFAKYIEMGLDEIKQTINLPKKELDSFADSVLERFNNPFIDHKLFDISLNSTAKFKTRCLPTIIDYIKINGKAPKILSFAFAAYIAFYMNVGTDRVYTPNDSQEVVEFFKDLEDGAHNVPKICTDVLANTSFWGENLTEYDSLLNAVEKSYSSIKTKGIEKALNEVVYG